MKVNCFFFFWKWSCSRRLLVFVAVFLFFFLYYSEIKRNKTHENIASFHAFVFVVNWRRILQRAHCTFTFVSVYVCALKNKTQTYAVNVTNACMSYGLLCFKLCTSHPYAASSFSSITLLHSTFIFLLFVLFNGFLHILVRAVLLCMGSKAAHNFNSNFRNSNAQHKACQPPYET